MEHRLVITVDGPAGAGKSTVSKALARRISYIYLDTGALYRAIAYKVVECGVSPDDDVLLPALCNAVTISLEKNKGDMKILVDGEDVTDKIRTEEIGLIASKVSAVPVVRKSLLSIQRQAGKQGGIVAEGRDMATVVFPHADLKFYLDADIPERARRRYTELLESGRNVDIEEVKTSLIKRDHQDSTRSISPLVVSDDSILINTTSLSIEAVVDKMASIVERHIENNE